MQRHRVGLLALLVVGCAPAIPIAPANQPEKAVVPAPNLADIPQVSLGSPQNRNAILIQLNPNAGFRTQADAKQLSDIDHYVVKLYRAAGPTLAYTHTTPSNANTAFYFNNVPDGGYFITAEAFDASTSITQGGPQTSSNTVSVSGATVTYSNAGSALTVALTLLDQTAAQLDSAVSVTPGANAPAITVTPH